ncbi:DUF406 family protein [Candidatus Enterovibrio altilux]|uniref:DUF406 domain-containing protein n=1 Tax=Candidatus Enterovibrio altilux TaxID=1927128 RepID=A0A291B6P7_9GAMM|nr:DUF406 family protein [Candidatus Enterovibrio luxaltus]ATF08665.1 hypothetical protein BTN50_0121 [Candidatus Enterovibrio luxaltus]
MNHKEYQVCDACGVAVEIGYVISEGDDVADVEIFASNKTAAIAKFHDYLALAKQVNAYVIHDFDEATDFAFNRLQVKLKFECSAEKLIFELRSRVFTR